MSDEDGVADSPSPGAVPLWRQFFEEQKKRHQATAQRPEKKLEREKIQQDMLKHVVALREAQGLPPFFAMITGPTIQKYFMEELSVTLGRVTEHHRDVTIHLGSSNPLISRLHACIFYDFELDCYCITNFSKNGIRVKRGEIFFDHPEVNVPIPLGNPAVIDIQGVLIYFQIFQIACKNGLGGTKGGMRRIEDGKRKVPGGGGGGSGGVKRRPGATTYAQMIEAALRALGGAGTQPEISDYIDQNFKDDIAGKKTWRNSISGVLSANALFIQEAIIDKGGKKDRKSLWRLKGYDPSMPPPPTKVAVKKEKEAKPALVAPLTPTTTTTTTTPTATTPTTTPVTQTTTTTTTTTTATTPVTTTMITTPTATTPKKRKRSESVKSTGEDKGDKKSKKKHKKEKKHKKKEKRRKSEVPAQAPVVGS